MVGRVGGKRNVCCRSEYFHKGVVILFRFLEFFILLFVAKLRRRKDDTEKDLKKVSKEYLNVGNFIKLGNV